MRDELESLQKFLCGNSRTRVDGELHLADLLINLLHEVDDEVDELVLVHRLCVEVGNQEADVITLRCNRKETFCWQTITSPAVSFVDSDLYLTTGFKVKPTNFQDRFSTLSE